MKKRCEICRYFKRYETKDNNFWFAPNIYNNYVYDIKNIGICLNKKNPRNFLISYYSLCNYFQGRRKNKVTIEDKKENIDYLIL